MIDFELIFLFFLIALIYSSVGFGGGSSYLAILSFYPIHFHLIRLTALLCNIAVVSGSVYLHLKNGLLEIKRSWPFVAFSIPLAFLAAQIKISDNLFYLSLAFILIISGILMLLRTRRLDADAPQNNGKNKLRFGMIVGGSIGFLSGLTGIGGGIFLSPFLNLVRWSSARKIAALSSFFILVNSLAGVGGQLLNFDPEKFDIKFVLSLILAVIIGGQIGTRLMLKKFDHAVVKDITAILILFAGLRLLWKYWPL
jgi:uncharacterized membrane protein YfcA